MCTLKKLRRSNSDVSRVFCADWCTYATHENATMVGGKWKNFFTLKMHSLSPSCSRSPSPSLSLSLLEEAV